MGEGWTDQDKKQLEARVRKLEEQCRALYGLAISQTATNALLIGMLVQSGNLTQEQGLMLAVCGKDTSMRPDSGKLTPEKVKDWIEQQIRKGGCGR